MVVSDSALATLSARVGNRLRQQGLRLTIAESCTGGLISQVVTHTAGSSNWFECSFVTYTNAAKQNILGINSDVLTKYGAVSEQTAREMALAALKLSSNVQVALSVTGIAGPTGGTEAKPVGTVSFAWVLPRQKLTVATRFFHGNREDIRGQTAMYSLSNLLNKLDITS